MLGNVVQHFEAGFFNQKVFETYPNQFLHPQALKATGLDFRKHYAKALYKFLSGRQLRGKWGGQFWDRTMSSEPRRLVRLRQRTALCSPNTQAWPGHVHELPGMSMSCWFRTCTGSEPFKILPLVP